MKVKKAIEILKQFDPEDEIWICDDPIEVGTHSPLSSIEKKALYEGQCFKGQEPPIYEAITESDKKNSFFKVLVK